MRGRHPKHIPAITPKLAAAPFTSTLEQQQIALMQQRSKDKARIDAFAPLSILITLIGPTLATRFLLIEGAPLHFVFQWFIAFFTGKKVEEFSNIIDRTFSYQQRAIERCSAFTTDMADMFSIVLSADAAPKVVQRKSAEIALWWPDLAAILERSTQTQNLRNRMYNISYALAGVLIHLPPELAPYISVTDTSATPIGEHIHYNTALAWKKIPTDMSFSTLGHVIIQGCKKLETIQKTDLNERAYFVRYEAPTLGMQATKVALMAAYVAASVPLKSLVVDRLLLAAYNRFISKTRTLNATQIQRLSEADAQKYILQLTNEINALTARGQSYRTIFRFLLPVLVILGLVKVLTNDKFSAEILILFLATLTAALSGAKKDIYDFRNARTLEQDRNTLGVRLNMLLKDCKQPLWELRKNRNSQHMPYFIFQADKYKNLSPGSVCRIIRNILLKKGIQFNTANTINLIFISPDIKLTPAVVLELNLQLQTVLDHRVNIKILHKQLNALDEYMDIIMKPFTDKNGLPSARFEIAVPTQYKTICDFGRLRIIFPGNEVTVEDNKFVLVGRTTGENKLLTILITEMKRIKTAEEKKCADAAPTSTPEEKTEKTHRREKPKSSAAPSEKTAESKESLPARERYPEITFQGVKYDPNREDSLLRPVPRISHSTNVFTFFGMTADDFGSDTSLYDRFKTTAKDPGPKAFVYTDECQVRDCSGRFFTAGAKFSIKGIDERVWGERLEDASRKNIVYDMKGLMGHKLR